MVVGRSSARRSFAVPTLQHLLDSRAHACAASSRSPIGRAAAARRSPTRPSRRWRSSTACPLFQPDRLKTADVAAPLRAWQPDLGVVAAYGRIIPEDLLTLPRLGMINVHASLLPKYRGAAPVHRAVIDGDAETGVTIMRVVKELDAGPMFATVTRPIAPDETSDVVERDLATLGAESAARRFSSRWPRGPRRRSHRTTRWRPMRRD